MPHDASKVLLGNTTSSVKEIDNRRGTIAAGLVVRLKADDTISLLAADGSPIGVSLGRDLSGTNRTAIVRKGLRVPIRLTGSFTPTIGAQVFSSNTTGLADATGTGLNATYASGKLTGIDEDGNNVDVAMIDMPGGL